MGHDDDRPPGGLGTLSGSKVLDSNRVLSGPLTTTFLEIPPDRQIAPYSLARADDVRIGISTDVEHSAAGAPRMVGSGLKRSATRTTVRAVPPGLGRHTGGRPAETGYGVPEIAGPDPSGTMR